MKLATRDDILSANDLQHEDVEVPEWNLTVRVKALTAGERDEYESLVFLDKKGDPAKRREDIRAKLVIFAVVSEDGSRMFTEADIPALTKKSAAAMNRLWAVATRLSKLGAEDMKELEKN